VMSQRSQVMALRVGWCAWCCHTSVMIATRREVESAEGRLQGADARVEMYKGAIVSAAARRERDAIRRRVMQVMSANARWKGASREVRSTVVHLMSGVNSRLLLAAFFGEREGGGVFALFLRLRMDTGLVPCIFLPRRGPNREFPDANCVNQTNDRLPVDCA
jgi:hypothetical protein